MIRHMGWRILLCLIYFISEVSTQNGKLCPNEWIFHSNSCYKLIFHTDNTYESAKKLCADSYNSNLISIGSLKEAEFIAELLLDQDYGENLWLTSGYKRIDNNWGWQGDGSNVTINYWRKNMDFMTTPVGFVIAYKKVGDRYKWESVRSDLMGSTICEAKASQMRKTSWAKQPQAFGVLKYQNLPLAPKLLEQSSSIVYYSDTQSGTQVTLTCRGEGSGNLRFKWFKDSSNQLDVSREKRFTIINGNLIITNFTSKDYGRYYCLISNAAGSIRSLPITISPAYVRKFPNTRTDVFAVEGLGKSVACEEPRHSPTNLGYTWMYDGVTNFMRNTENVFISKDGTLYYSSINKTDEKRLACNIVSPSIQSGQYGPFFNLKVESANGNGGKPFKPMFPAEFPKIFPAQLEIHKSAVLECFAYGRPSPSYKWERVNPTLPINGSIENYNRIILLKNLRQSDAGTYRCTAYNSVGSVSVDLHLSVNMKPLLLEQMKDQFAHVDSIVHFDCLTHSVPVADIEWFKDGIPINPLVLSELDSQRIRMIKSRLTISSTMEKDAGVYQCFATNPIGQLSASAQLIIKNIPATLDKLPRNQIVFAQIGHKLQLMCKAEGSPTPLVTWTHNTQSLKSDKTVQPGKYGDLQMTNVTYLDDGFYNCYATNDLDSVSYSQTVKVTRKYSIGMQPKLLAIDIGSQLTLKCPVMPQDDCGFESIVTWEFNNYPVLSLPQFDQSKVSKDKLMIKAVTKAHAGLYLCTALTPSGMVASSTVITINGPPLAPVDVRLEQTSQFEVKVTWVTQERAKSALTHVYRIETSTLVRSKETWSAWETLTECVKPEIIKEQIVTGLQPFTVYKFRILAGNHLGWSLPSFESDTIETEKSQPEKFPQNLRSSTGKIGEIKIHWEPLNEKYWNDASLSYLLQWRIFNENTWKNVEIRNPNASSSSIFLPKTNITCQKYEARIGVKNSLGTGPYSGTIEIHSSLSAPKISPVIDNVEVLNASAVNISWHLDNLQFEENCNSAIAFRISYRKVNEPIHWGDFINIFCSNQTNAILTDLPPWSTLTFNIAAFNSVGLGPVSQPFIATTTKYAPKRQPDHIEIIQGHPDKKSISVSWNQLELDHSEEILIGYRVLLYHGATSQPQIFSINVNQFSGSQPQIQVSGLNPTKRYGIQLLGYSRGGDGPSTKRLDFVFEPHSVGFRIRYELWTIFLVISHTCFMGLR